MPPFERSRSRPITRVSRDERSRLSIRSRRATCRRPPPQKRGAESSTARETRANLDRTQLSYVEESGSTVERKRVAVVFPTAWDEKHFQKEQESDQRYEVELKRPFDRECHWDYDVLGYIEEQVAAGEGLSGVFSSSDYPGAIAAAAISRRLGLPGSPPSRILGCSHKYYSRIAQREAAPESTPWFQLVDPMRPRGGVSELHFPCFVKPVKGAFSVMSRRLDWWKDVDSFLSRPSLDEFLRHYVFMFNGLVRGLTDFELDGSYFIAEDLLKGRQATVEGYAAGGSVEVLGIVDSVRHPGTRSFVRFDYPSSLSRRVQARMREVAVQVVRRLGLKNTSSTSR